MRFFVFLNTFLRNTTAVVGLEFSLVLPVLLVLFLGMVDITNMIYTKQKISNTAEMFQNFVARPRFDTMLGGSSKMLTKVKDFLIPKLTQIANNSGIRMGFAVYILDAGNVIPQIKTLGTDDEKRTLYVAYRKRFGDLALMPNPRLKYVRTGSGTINKAYFNKNKLTDNDIIYKDLGGKNNYDALTGNQYVVVETNAQYDPVFSANRYTGLTGIINMHIETKVRIVEDRFKRLPDGGYMH